MSDECTQGIDIFKWAGLILGGWGAGLSTYNFFASHFSRMLIEYIPDLSGQSSGKIRILCLGRPRFVDEMIIKDEEGSAVLVEEIAKTLARGESHRKIIAKNSLAKTTVYEVEVFSGRRTYSYKFHLD